MTAVNHFNRCIGTASIERNEHGEKLNTREGSFKGQILKKKENRLH
jgi:hypothetical protein